MIIALSSKQNLDEQLLLHIQQYRRTVWTQRHWVKRVTWLPFFINQHKKVLVLDKTKHWIGLLLTAYENK